MILGSRLWRELFVADADTPAGKSFPADPKTPRKYERHRPALQRHIDLDLVLDHGRRSLQGTVQIVFEVKDRLMNDLVIDAKELDIIAVSFAPCSGLTSERFGQQGASALAQDWQDVRFSCADDCLTVHDLANQVPLCARSGFFVLRIEYAVTNPRAGLYFVDPKESPWIKTPCIWTQGQDVDASFWFPCQDDPRLKVTTRLKCTVPSGWIVESNGEKRDGAFVMTSPHAVYLVALVAGRFAVAERLWRGKPVVVMVSKAYQDLADEIADKTLRMMDVYSDYWRVPYPWPRYVQAFVPEFLYGGMENTTLTINTENVLGDDTHARSLEDWRDALIMHELAHQWFGDLVTCEAWSEGWLNEGFATHSEIIWDDHVHGPVNAQFYALQNFREGYLGEARVYTRPLVCNHYEFVSEIFDAHLYDKGAMILNHLRDLLGDGPFRDAVRHYLETHAFGSVTTGDLMRSIEVTTGWNPREFFDNYVFGSGHFDVKISLSLQTKTKDTEHPEGGACIIAEVEGSSGLSSGAKCFETFVAFYGARGLLEKRRVRLDVSAKKIEWSAPVGTEFAIVDPQATVIGRWEQSFSESMARSILTTHKKHGNGYFCWLAAKSLLDRGQAHLKKVPELIQDWLEHEAAPLARGAGYRLLGDRAGALVPLDWSVLLRRERDISAKAVLLDIRARRADAEEALGIMDDYANTASNRKEITILRRACLHGLRAIVARLPESREPERLVAVRAAALVCAAEQRHNGYLAPAAAELLIEIMTEQDLMKLVALSHDRDLPGPARRWALQACARGVGSFPEKKNQVLPALRRYADVLPPDAPASLITFLPQIWQASRDVSFDGAFQRFLRRKSYGLMSMRIPQARRAYKSYLAQLSPLAIAEKFAAYEDLARRFDKLENDFRLHLDAVHGRLSKGQGDTSRAPKDTKKKARKSGAKAVAKPKKVKSKKAKPGRLAKKKKN
jgi:hypothetical protein